MMKSMFYLLLALTAVLAATASDFKPDPILDTDGNTVVGGHSYYLIPAVPGKGGGLGLAGRGDKKCPLDIVQESSEENNGIPVRFSDWWSNIGYVPQTEILRVEMDVGDTACCRQTYWKYDSDFDKERKQLFVIAAPKDRSSSSTYHLKKSGDGYKFVWCPSIDCAGKLCSEECDVLGIFVDEKGVRRLVASSEPHLVKFKKADGGPDYLSKSTI
ncbi:unnamed protein product [Microthlaspi erraticum]|uniref:Uncharacterized protein n=1 Tax=Microthlaspi erraticum TaxID=1685480 RepID=A0A6D2JTG2_9BRAS|nr:unnamed protein product [Microthlaspi erraticum]